MGCKGIQGLSHSEICLFFLLQLYPREWPLWTFQSGMLKNIDAKDRTRDPQGGHVSLSLCPAFSPPSLFLLLCSPL